MRRWLLWNVVCLRGRRCAHLIVTNDHIDAPHPEGVVVWFDYDCAGCGTHYRTSVMLSGGVPIQAPRIRT